MRANIVTEVLPTLAIRCNMKKVLMRESKDLTKAKVMLINHSLLIHSMSIKNILPLAPKWDTGAKPTILVHTISFNSNDFIFVTELKWTLKMSMKKSFKV